jgi:hypothetical protein
MADRNNSARRRRSSSILQVYHEPPETLEQISDQAVLPNLNANWTSAKGMNSVATPQQPLFRQRQAGVPEYHGVPEYQLLGVVFYGMIDIKRADANTPDVYFRSLDNSHCSHRCPQDTL